MRNFASFVFATLVVSAHADITSSFDANAEGWRAANVAATGAITYQDPTWTNGHIEATEFASGLFLLAAPAAYLGDLSAYAGGTVSFRLADATADGVPYPALILQSGSATMYYDAPAPGTSLTAYSVPLSPAGWRISSFGANDPAPTATQFRSILSGVTQFGINADWTTGTVDRVALDDVRVAAVPEPTTVCALGLGLFGAMRRRKRQPI